MRRTISTTHKEIHLYPNSPVLASGSAVEVNNNLYPMATRPSDSLLEVWKLSLDVGLSGTNFEGPVPYGDANMVQAGRSGTISVSKEGKRSRPRDSPSIRDVNEVLLCDPGVPVILENRQGGASALELPKGPLVDDGGVAGVVEQTRGDPWL